MFHQQTRNYFFKSVILGLTLLFSFTAIAQSEIKGVLIGGEDKEPLIFASVSLFKTGTGEYAKGTQTDIDGYFAFKDVAPGSYTLRANYVGFEELIKNDIRMTSGMDVDLGHLALVTKGQILSEVVVQGTKPAMELRMDRKIFNVAQSTIAVGGTATDLLGNIPSLQVDMDGSVSLRGSSSVRILIDGKESSMAGNDITALLQSLPANSIDKVEIITNPSAKFDAEGQSGIINIVLKRDVKTGLNGSVNASLGSYWNNGAGFDLNYRSRKFTYSGNFNLNNRKMFGDGWNETQFFDSGYRLKTESENSRVWQGKSAGLGLEYRLTDRTTLGVSGRMNFRNNNGEEDIFYSYLNNPELTDNSQRHSDQSGEGRGFDLNFNVKQAFKNNKGELTASVRRGGYDGNGENEFNQFYTVSQALIENRVNNNDNSGRNLDMKADYEVPFSETSKFGAGVSSITRKSADTQLSQFMNQALEMTPDYGVSNEFEQNSGVHATYLNYENQITKTFGFQVGLRAEQSTLETKYVALNPDISLADRTTTGGLDYFRLYPSLFLTKKIGEEDQFQLSYTRRVNRPRGWQVNPFVDVSDPMNKRQGNPNLMPEDIHAFELNYAKFWEKITLNSSLYHRRINDVIQPITTAVEGTDGVTFSQFQNISKNEATGLELISQMDLTQSLNITANANFFYRKFYGSEEFNIKPTDGFNWNTNVTANYKIVPSVQAQVRFEYRAPMVQAQGRSFESYIVDAGLKIDVLDKKGTISLNGRDLFNQRKWAGYTQTAQFYRENENRWSRRMFMASFTYRFGSKPDFNNNKKKDNKQKENQEGGGEFEGGPDFK